jgi:hypothetical protein
MTVKVSSECIAHATLLWEAVSVTQLLYSRYWAFWNVFVTTVWAAVSVTQLLYSRYWAFWNVFEAQP